ncbi:MAG: protein kinase [Phaeospirillum sp.]|nr:protein kinase [Phaeospirillum sp.]
MTASSMLLRTNAADVCLVTYGGIPAVMRYQDIVAALSERGKAHLAAFLAEPRISGGSIEWFVTGTGVFRPLTMLTGDERAKAQATLSAHLSEMSDMLGEPGGADLLSAVLAVPSLDAAMVGPNGVVLVGWGCLAKGSDDSTTGRATNFRSTLGTVTNFSFDAGNGVSGFGPAQAGQRSDFAPPSSDCVAMALFSDSDEGSAMNIGRACTMLGLSGNPNRQTVDDAYRKKRDEIEARLAKIPVEALKAKYRESIKELDVARDLLFDDDSSAVSALNATKMFDLPGASPLQTAFSPTVPGGGGGVALAIGDTLSQRYQIRRRLGAGGMGMVFAAYDGNREREIAIKVLQTGLLNSREAQERFLAEAKFSSDLSHPNIVNVFDVQRENALTYLTMELLEGRTLRQEMDDRRAMRRPFTLDEVRQVATAIGEALSYAHHISVHRDIKPENIWYGDGAGSGIKLMDFGIARLLGPGTMNTAAMPMGTAYYMAPEQMTSARDVDHRADQYSLGVVLYEMLVGVLPAGRIKPVRESRTDVPAGMSKALDRALEADREQRFPDMTAFLAGLTGKSNMLVTLMASLVPATAAPPSRRGSGAPINPALIAATLALLVIGGGGLLIAGDRISDLFASFSHDSDSEAKALSEYNKTALVVERWEFISRALDNTSPPDAVKNALARFKAGTVNMERKHDQKAVADFIAAREVLSLEMQKVEASQRADALFQMGSVQALRKRFDDLPTTVERERQEARNEVKQAERAASGSKSGSENGEANGLLARARVDLELKDHIHDYLTTRVLSSTDYSAVQGRFAVADSLLKEQRFTEAKVELLAMGKTMSDMRQGFEANRSLLEAKYSARKAKAELDATAAGGRAGSSEEYGRADAFMRRGEALGAQANIQGAIAAYGEAAPIYERLAANAVKASYARKQAEGEAEIAARKRRVAEDMSHREQAQKQQMNQVQSQQAMQQAQQAMQQEIEDKRLKLEREKMERTQQMQERQIQAQKEAESNRLMMQGVGTLFSIMGR